MDLNYYQNLLSTKGDSIPPLIAQYLKVKSQHQDYLVFFRVGEFYELLFDDALKVYKSVAITLTKRRIKGNDIPLCGVPAFSYESYVAKLVGMGYKVAVCNQLEESNKEPSGLVKREVVQKVTPGVVPYNFLLEDSDYNFLLMVYSNPSEDDFYYLAWADVATYDIFVEKIDKKLLINSLNSINPKEIIANENVVSEIAKTDFKATLTTLKKREKHQDIISIVQNNLVFEDELAKNNKCFVFSVGYLLSYIKSINCDIDLLLFKKPQLINNSSYLKLDSFTVKSLELLKKNDGLSANSLKSLLDYTLTNVGSKYLKSLILRPHGSHVAINERLKVVDFLINNAHLLDLIEKGFQNFKNIQRCVSDILSLKHSFKDLIVAKNAIKYIYKLKVYLYSCNNTPQFLDNLLKKLDFDNNLLLLLEDALLDHYIDDDILSSFVKRGYNANIDQCCDFLSNKDEKLSDLERYYRELYSLSKIKVLKNTIYGYYLSTPNKDLLNDNGKDLSYLQSLANETRYKSKKLAELEFEILKNQTLKNDLEKQISNNIASELVKNSNFMYALVDVIAQIDIFQSFAKTAINENYTKPIVDKSNNLIVKNGYHPVLKKSFVKQNKEIVKNNLEMIDCNSSVYILTAPNMAGKSTYLRQNAIIIILAQMACYVPASYVHLGVRDAIYSRVGSYDEILKDKSTFMVEMEECAFILKHASDRSFIIFDEIGRGTSSKDGSALSQAIIEYVSNNIKCKAILTTHYHELIDRIKDFDNLKFYTIATDSEKEVKFLYKVVEGIAKHSYGIFVASLAGLPQSVVDRAKYIAEKKDKIIYNKS